jgi:hypothetical protein
MLEPCGFCSGRGFVYGSMYDSYGYQRYHEPPQLTCEYCGGFGRCESGAMLLPAKEPETEEQQSTGLPPWA